MIPLSRLSLQFPVNTHQMQYNTIKIGCRAIRNPIIQFDLFSHAYKTLSNVILWVSRAKSLDMNGLQFILAEFLYAHYFIQIQSLLISVFSLQIMIQQIHNLLSQTLANDTQNINKATHMLATMSDNNGFCLTLMEIVDEPTVNQSIKQAALTQLKLSIKNKWKVTNSQCCPLDSQEKIKIKNYLIRAITRCDKNYRLVKQYCQVLKLVVQYDYEKWMGLIQIKEKLTANQNLSATIYCLLAISTYFEESVIDKEKKIFYYFLKNMLPQVLKVIKNNISNTELIYLGFKFLWKAVHNRLPIEVKLLVCSWMELILMVINGYNQDLQNNFSTPIAKYSPEFYYFHAKKWATRIVLRFVQKHAKPSAYDSTPQQIEFSKIWHQKYGAEFMESIVQQVPISSIKKVKYFQFKVMRAWISENPKLLYQYAQRFQDNYLMHFMSQKQEDQKKAYEDPIQFIRSQDNDQLDFTNLKQASVQLWIAFMQLDSQTDRVKKIFYPGQLFFSSFNLIKTMMSHHFLSKEISMRLFAKIKDKLIMAPQCHSEIYAILSEYVIPELNKNEVMLLKVRANQIVYKYGAQQLPGQLLQEMSKGVLKCLEHETALVRIKAMSALESILWHPSVQQFMKPYLPKVLECYLKMIKQYDLEDLITSLNQLIKIYAFQIGPFTIEMFRQLSNFVKDILDKRDTTTSANKQAELSAQVSMILHAMAQIIRSPLDQETRNILNAEIIKLCGYLFSREKLDMIAEIMHLLNCYLYKIQSLNGQSMFYFQVAIYFLVGLPPEIKAQVESLPQNHANRNILLNINRGKSVNVNQIENAFPVLRNYMTKTKFVIENQKEPFRINFFQMLFFLVGEIYKGFATPGLSSFEMQLAYSSMLLVYLVETYSPEDIVQPESTLMAIWSFIKFNSLRSKSLQVKLVNTQLIAVCLWKIPDPFLKLVASDGQNIDLVINEILNFHGRFNELQERKRLILGISTFILKWGVFKQKNRLQQVPLLFKILLRLVLKNCISRKIKIFEKNNMKDEASKASASLNAITQNYDNDGLQVLADNDDDEDDIWDQNYDQLYHSLLVEYDEILEFKKSMDVLQNQSSEVYQELIKVVPNQHLVNVTTEMDETEKLQKTVFQSEMKE